MYNKTIGNWKTELLRTWNVWTLQKPGAALDLVKELKRYKIKCVALQEIKWKDAGITKMLQTTIFNGEYEKAYRLGIGFAVHESILYI